MNGSVVFSNDDPPPSLANATSSTATRPSILLAGGRVRGVRNANRGSVPEVVEDGVTGFIVRDGAEMAARLRALDGFDRARCRARAIERWSSMRMAADYERIYAEVTGARSELIAPDIRRSA